MRSRLQVRGQHVKGAMYATWQVYSLLWKVDTHQMACVSTRCTQAVYACTLEAAALIHNSPWPTLRPTSTSVYVSLLFYSWCCC